MLKNHCPLCDRTHLQDFLQRPAVPVHQNLPYATQANAQAAPTGELRLTICEQCGFVFNRSFDLNKLSYGSDYDNAQTHSGVFVDHLDSLVKRLVEHYQVRNCTIVEVGCGQGDFLNRLVQPPEWGNRGYGFDPSYQGPESLLDGRLQFQRRYYDADCAEIMADVVVCRHVIEHVDRPLPMLRAIRQALAKSPNARVFFETPCVDWIIDRLVLWDFFYEHCSYFNAASLATAFRATGFDVLNVHHVFGGQYLWLEAQLGNAEVPDSDVSPACLQQAQVFGQQFQQLVQAWQQKIDDLSQTGRVALWGAGAKGVTLANLIDRESRLVAALIDLNPNKQGKFIPGSGHPIIDYREAANLDITQAILMNPNYYEENLVLLNAAQLSLNLVV
jgi:SAM-dependent methyltransferase